MKRHLAITEQDADHPALVFPRSLLNRRGLGRVEIRAAEDGSRLILTLTVTPAEA